MMLRILERRNTTLILQCYLKRPADKVADYNLTALIHFSFICFYGHSWQGRTGSAVVGAMV